MLPQVLLLSLLILASASTDLLQNADFESPPSNLPERMRPPFLLSKENNILPGWTFEGTVMYVASDETISLPSNGHGVSLGEDGMINQTFTTSAGYMHYVLSFTVAPGGQNCSANNVVVSAPDSKGVFSLKQHYGKEAWESYGHYLGSWDKGELVNLVIQSQAAEFNSSAICPPVIDKLLLKSMPKLVQDNDNLLLNGGFEYGPEFLNKSTEGILIDPAPSPVQSPLPEWSVLGTVRYIDSNHFFVPQGNAAVEIVSGVSAGVQIATQLTEGSTYKLEFTLGDANNSCVEDFIVEAQAGSTGQNFTLSSQGTGSAKKFSIKFKADSSVTPISFMSYTTSQTKDGVLCGPVVDDVVLRASHGVKPYPQWKFLVFLYLLAILYFQ